MIFPQLIEASYKLDDVTDPNRIDSISKIWHPLHRQDPLERFGKILGFCRIKCFFCEKSAEVAPGRLFSCGKSGFLGEIRISED